MQSITVDSEYTSEEVAINRDGLSFAESKGWKVSGAI